MYCVNPIQTGWGFLGPPKNYKVKFNFEAVQAMTAKLCDFS